MVYFRSFRTALFLIAATVLVSCAAANATSRIKRDVAVKAQDDAASAPASYCEVRGEFVGPGHVGQFKVFWTIDISERRSVGDAACPQGPQFEISMRGAEFVDSLGDEGQYVYAVEIVQPPHKQRVIASVRLMGSSEWVLTDWNDGFKIQKE